MAARYRLGLVLVLIVLGIDFLFLCASGRSPDRLIAALGWTRHLQFRLGHPIDWPLPPGKRLSIGHQRLHIGRDRLKRLPAAAERSESTTPETGGSGPGDPSRPNRLT